MLFAFSGSNEMIVQRPKAIKGTRLVSWLKEGGGPELTDRGKPHAKCDILAQVMKNVCPVGNPGTGEKEKFLLRMAVSNISELFKGIISSTNAQI